MNFSDLTMVARPIFAVMDTVSNPPAAPSPLAGARLNLLDVVDAGLHVAREQGISMLGYVLRVLAILLPLALGRGLRNCDYCTGVLVPPNRMHSRR